MKTLNICLIALLFHFSCNGNSGKKTVSVTETSVQALSAASDTCALLDIQSSNVHPISFEDAAKYIVDFTKKFKSLSSVQAGCVEIPRDSLFPMAARPTLTEDPRCGLLLHYVLDTDSNLALAWRMARGFFPSDDPISLIVADKYYHLSVCHQAFDSIDLVNGMKTTLAIANYQNICHEENRTILGSDVVTSSRLAKTLLNKLDPIPVTMNPLAFFHKRQLMDLVTSRDHMTNEIDWCRSIRIYWGYDESDTAGNRIRLVAIGVDGHGNIIPDDNKMLERSWPPF